MSGAWPVGRVIGQAATGLSAGNNGWAANAGVAAAGARGEVRTALVLDALALLPGGVTVLHDVLVPGGPANVDHVVVQGSRVLLLDSKSWLPGFYWTWGGRTRRGWSEFKVRDARSGKDVFPGDKKTMAMAGERFSRLLASRGLPVEVSSMLVVWPSRGEGAARVWAYRPVAATAMSGDGFARWARRRFSPAAGNTAHPGVVATFEALVNHPAASRGDVRPEAKVASWDFGEVELPRSSASLV